MNTVERIENSFTDRFAASCARVSFGSTTDDYSDERVAGLIDYLVRNRHINPLFHPMITVRLSQSQINLHQLVQNKSLMAGLNLYKKDKMWIVTTSAWGLMELVRFMNRYKWLHDMPAFSNSYNNYINSKDNLSCAHLFDVSPPHHHQWFSFRFNTEMNTKNQLYTHTVGLAKSSQSFRYVDDVDFYIPKEWRGKAENVKQGSSDDIVEEEPDCYPHNYKGQLDRCKWWYQGNAQICNEQRRYILPQAQMTKYVITGTREAWERVLKLRLAKDAQKEVRLIAENIADEIASDKVWI